MACDIMSTCAFGLRFSATHEDVFWSANIRRFFPGAFDDPLWNGILIKSSWCTFLFCCCTGWFIEANDAAGVGKEFVLRKCVLCRHPRQWTQHGGLRQSFLSYPPPLQEKDDSDGSVLQRVWAAKLSPQHMCARLSSQRMCATAHGSEKRADFVHSSHESSLSGFVQTFVPAVPQVGCRQSPTECMAYGSEHAAARECSRYCVREAQRPSTALPQQASYMKPTASFLAKTAQCRSKGQECTASGREQAPIRIPCPPSEEFRCGRDQAHYRTGQQQPHIERSLSGGSDDEICMVGSSLQADSNVSLVVNALMDVTQLQQDLKKLGSKNQSLQALSKVRR